MIVGLLQIQIYMQGLGSLKDKRRIVKSLIERLKGRFNISVAEVDKQDNRVQAIIGLAFVSNDSRFVNSRLDKIIDFMRKDGRFTLGRIEREML